jgi:inward rectifier potassium channel
LRAARGASNIPACPPDDPIDDRDGRRRRPPPPASTPTSGSGASSRRGRGRFLSHDGEPTSRKYGLGAQRIERFYLRALSTPLPLFLAWALGALLLVNGFFTLAYLALGDGALRGGEALELSDPFLRAFAFSVGVFTTTGTGPAYAVGSTAHWLVVFESFVGPFVLVATAGLLIARLTRPRMRLRFSESAVVAPYEDGRGLMFRMVNAQPGELSDVQVRVSLTLLEDAGDGRREREFYPLALERTRWTCSRSTGRWCTRSPPTARSPARRPRACAKRRPSC